MALTFHLLAAVIWVGGMFFAYVCLRPVMAEQLEPPVRLRMWNGVFARFFTVVWVVVVTIPLTGHYMILLEGGLSNTSPVVQTMMALGYVMIALYVYLSVDVYSQFRGFIRTQQWKEAANILNRMRRLVAINLFLGLLIIVLASSGEHFL